MVGWLDEPQPELRRAAARALATIGDARMLPALVRLLGDADVAVRLAAVQTVATLGGSEATVPLLDRLADAESTVRVATANALGELGDPRAVLSLLGTLQDPMPEVRQAAAIALGKLRDPRAARGLLTLLRDPQMDVRLAAVRALGALGNQEAVIDLAPLALREDRAIDANTRNQLARAALEAIGNIGGAQAREVLVRAFRRNRGEQELLRVTTEALLSLGTEAEAAIPSLTTEPIPHELLVPLIELLGAIGGDRAASALISLYESPDGVRVADAVLRALGRTGSPRALPLLLRTASVAWDRGRSASTPSSAINTEFRRRAAIAGLKAYAERRHGLPAEALDPLAEILQSTSRESTGQVARELTTEVVLLMGQTGNPRAPSVLAPWLRSNDRQIRTAVATSLARVGIQGIEQLAVQALSDPSPEVRIAIADALGRHGTRTALDALLTFWNAQHPIDRANAARAIGMLAARFHDPRGGRLLANALTQAAPALAAALLDALSYLAQAGDILALRALFTAVEHPSVAPTAVEAMVNAIAGAPTDVRTVLIAHLMDLTRRSDALAVRAMAVWGLSRGSSDVLPTLVSAMDDPHPAVVTNAAGALARLFSTGIAPTAATRDALCRALDIRRHPMVRTNVLLALARGRLVCNPDRQRRLLLDGRSPWVRQAAAESLTAVITIDPSQQAWIQTALARCAATDRTPEVASACRRLAGASSPSERSVVSDTIDAVVMGEDEETVLSFAPVALILDDGLVRMGWTGPEGWIHERPAPHGRFTVLDPEEQPPEP